GRGRGCVAASRRSGSSSGWAAPGQRSAVMPRVRVPGPKTLIARQVGSQAGPMATDHETGHQHLAGHQHQTEHLAVHQSLELLRSAPVGRLAVVIDGEPALFPVNHVVDRGTVVFRTGAGMKLAAATGQMVAYEVDGYALQTGIAWSVVVTGKARQVRMLHEV